LDNGQFEFLWLFRLSEVPTEELTVIQLIRVIFRNWRYCDSHATLGQIGMLSYFEVVGTVAANAMEPVVQLTAGANADTWRFRSTASVNGRVCCGQITMQGQVRAFRTADIAEMIRNWKGGGVYHNSGRRADLDITWTSGTWPSNEGFFFFKDTQGIVEREGPAGAPTFTILRTSWGCSGKREGTRTRVLDRGPNTKPASGSEVFE